MIKKILTCIMFSALGSTILFCQDFKNDVSKQVEAIRKKQISMLNTRPLLTYDNKKLLKYLKNYDSDTGVLVRFNIQILEYGIALNNPSDPEVKKDVVRRFITALKDKSPLISQHAAKKLLTFSCNDFDKKSIAMINEIASNEKFSNKEIILIIGVADIQSQKKNLTALINNEPITTGRGFHTTNWAAHLALARMGSNEDIDFCIKNVSNLKDSVNKVTTLLNDIGYIRREPAIFYLKKYLDSDAFLTKASSDVPAVKSCQYALDALTQMLEDFPVKGTGACYSRKDIELARTWMNSQKKYKIKR